MRDDAVGALSENCLPKGSLDLDLDAVDAERLFFIERFLYRTTRARLTARR